MAYFSYDAITMAVESFQRFDQRSVYSDDGADYLFTEFTIVLRSLWHPKAVSDSFGSAPTSMNALRSRLMAPRKQLIVSSPNGGAGGSTIFLRSPLFRPDGVTSYFCDAKNGPQPLFCNIQEIIGEDTMVVDFGIMTWVNECPGSVSNPINPVLSHRWAMSHIIDDKFHTRRIVAGTAVLRTDLVYSSTGKPLLKSDDFRDYFFHNVPPNYKRVGVQVEATSDGTRLQYVIEDQEVDSVVDPALYNSVRGAEIADIDATYMEATEAAEGIPSGTLSAVAEGAASGAFIGSFLGPGGTAAGTAIGAAMPTYKAIAGLFPTKVFQLNVTVIGTRRATRAGLVQVALRCAAGFQLGTAGIPNQIDVSTIIRNLVQNFMISNSIRVGLVQKRIDLSITYRGSAVTGAILQAAGVIQKGVIGTAGMVGSAAVNVGAVIAGNRANPAGQVNIFRAAFDNPANPAPLSAYDPAFPEQIAGVTKVNGLATDSYGPRGGNLSFGGEKGSRGTTIAHLLTAALNSPCTKPAVPVPADSNWNGTGNPNNTVRN